MNLTLAPRLCIVAFAILLSRAEGVPGELARVDALGDPLPDGAVFRLGTTRWRHGGRVSQVAFLDGKTLVSCGEDQAIRVWDIAEGKEIRRLEGGRSQDFTLSADRKTLATVGPEYTLTLYEAATGRKLRTFKAAGGGSYPVALAPNGAFLATAQAYETLIWDLDEEKARVSLKLTAGALAFSSDGKRLAAATGKAIHLHDTASGERLATLEGHGERVHALVFLPGDDHVLVSAAQDCTIRWWDIGRRKETRAVKQQWVSGLAVSDDGGTLAAAGHQVREGILLYDAKSGKRLLRLPSGPENMSRGQLAFSPDGRLLASGGPDCLFRVYDVATGKSLGEDAEHRHGLRHMRLSSDGRVLATGGQDRFVQLWDVRGEAKPARLASLPVAAGHGAYMIEFVDKGKTAVAFDSRFYKLKYWDAGTGELTHTAQMPAHSCWGPALSPDGATLAISDSNIEALVLADARTGKEIRRLPMKEHLGSGQAMIYSPDGRFIATRDAVLDVKSGKVVATRPEHFSPQAFAFDPRSERLVWSSYNGLRIADLAGGGIVALFERDETRARSAVAFSPDGRKIAWAGREEIHLLDAASGKTLRQWRGHRGLITALQFAPDGRTLYSGAQDCTVLAWDVDPGR